MASGDRWAGAEVQLATLLRAFQRVPKLSVSAICLNEGQLAEEARHCGVDVCVLPESEKNFFQILLGATRFLQGKNIRVLHSHRYKENVLAAVLARMCHVPVHVCSRHGAPEPFKGWRRYKQGLVQSLDLWVARYFSESVITVSEDLRTQLVRHVPATKVFTIHNGIDTEDVYSRLTASEAKRCLSIPEECRVIGTAGRLDPIKRLDLFLAAAREIATARPDTRFVIAGDGEEASRLRELARALGLQDSVLFLGHRNDVYDVLRAMDIFVLSSDHEGLPMALLEALYLGVAVVARSVGGIADVIENGVSGTLVDSPEPSALAGACLRVLADEKRRMEMTQEGKRLVTESFTVQRTAAEVTDLYQSLSGVK